MKSWMFFARSSGKEGIERSGKVGCKKWMQASPQLKKCFPSPMSDSPEGPKNKELESIYSGYGKIKYRCSVRPIKNPEKIETLTVEARSFEEAIEKLQRDHYLIIAIEIAGGGRKSASGLFGVKFPSVKRSE